MNLKKNDENNRFNKENNLKDGFEISKVINERGILNIFNLENVTRKDELKELQLEKKYNIGILENEFLNFDLNSEDTINL